MEQLLCLPVPAEMWETEILPARLHPYSTSWLDTIMQEGELRWTGSANRRAAFCFESDLDLMQADAEAPDGDAQRDEDTIFEELFPHAHGRYDFSTLMDLSKYRSDRLSDRLWREVWRGKVSNDTFAALRKGIENRYKVPKTTSTTRTNLRSRSRRMATRASFSRWKGSLPSAGNWFQLPAPETSNDLIETEERKKDRARLLLDRYGILFKQLLERESPAFQWSSIFRSLRLMELSGEVLAGYFFHGIPGPQFISHQAFRMLQRKLPEDAVYWANATDPASICGLQVEAIRGSLPKRVTGTHLVYRGNRLVVISQRNGGALTFNVPPDDPHLPEYLGFLHNLLTRQFQPVRRITIKTINGEDAAGSDYLDILRTCFDVMVDYRSVILYRKVSG
jgi:ATP-dependent Lhr-like helicase